jgi:hypothetical protein
VPANDGSHRGGAPASDDLDGAQAKAVLGSDGPLGWSFNVVVASFGHVFSLSVQPVLRRWVM